MRKLKNLIVKLLAFSVVTFPAAAAFAQDGAASENSWAYALAAGLGLGLAAFAGALGQSRAAAATLEGISRNPNAAGKVFVPMILGLAFIESLVLFVLVIAFMLLGKF